ncbi:MAG: type IV secretory system conjugative DNA transfer family protein [Rhodobacteraceae bacterium]|nr:type IV secretory system conjugative DNA transfer family protein [Paracoccaceae bacterium]
MTFLLGMEPGGDPGAGIGFAVARHAAPGGDPNAVVRDPHPEGHWLCVAPMGSGKTVNFVVPQLLDHPGPVIALDIKGELTKVTARYRQSLGPVLVFDPFHLVSDGSGAFNPLSHLDVSSPTIVDDVYAIASLFSNPADAGRNIEAYWEDWGQDIVAGLILAALGHEDPRKRSLGEAYAMMNTDDVSYSIAVALDTRGKKMHRFAYQKLASLLQLPDITRGGVISCAQQQLRMLAGDGVQAAVAQDSIDLDLLSRGEPCTVYVVIPPDKLVSHATLVRIVLTALVQRMMRRRRAPRQPTLLLIDEATQFGPIPALQSAITLGRSFGIRAALIVQSMAQLKQAYGKMTDALVENSSLLTMGRHMAYSMSRQLAEQGFGDVSPEALYALGGDEVMVRVRGERSRRLRKLSYLTHPSFTGRSDPNPFYDRGL